MVLRIGGRLGRALELVERVQDCRVVGLGRQVQRLDDHLAEVHVRLLCGQRDQVERGVMHQAGALQLEDATGLGRFSASGKNAPVVPEGGRQEAIIAVADQLARPRRPLAPTRRRFCETPEMPVSASRNSLIQPAAGTGPLRSAVFASFWCS